MARHPKLKLLPVSGILEILSQNEEIVRLDLSLNALSLRGVKRLLSPSRLYPQKLGKLKFLNLAGNFQLGQCPISLFSSLKSLSELSLSSVDEEHGSRVALCSEPLSHSVPKISTKFAVAGLDAILLNMMSGQALPKPTNPDSSPKIVLYCHNEQHHCLKNPRKRARKRARKEISGPQSKKAKQTVFEMWNFWQFSRSFDYCLD